MSFFRKRNRMKDQFSTNQKKVTHSPINEVSRSLKENVAALRESLGQSDDIIIREFQIYQQINASIVYVDGLVDIQSIQEFILKVMMFDHDSKVLRNEKKNDLDLLKKQAISIGEVHDEKDFKKTLNNILSGDAAIFIEGINTAVIAATRGWEHREVTEPTTQNVIRGPKESFTESIRTNTSLLRRKIKDPDLRVETNIIGKHTQTDVSIISISSVTNPKVLQEVRDRLKQIDIDGILESAYIEELIEDKTSSPFPTVFNTERPDVVAAALLEGRVAILIDGTPFALIVPALFIHYFQSPEDYYERSFFGVIRVLRFLAFFAALLIPSLYIAVTTFHQEMIPTQLLIDLAAQRDGIPFPALVEALIMEVTFEILREAGIRMPRAVGQAISIVGALVLGQAAVQAGLVSPTMVIVVSITAISNFVFPSYDMALSVRILRFGFMILAATFGLFGIAVGLFLLLLHLCSLRSFGMPYMSPIGPFSLKEQKDAVFRFPRRWLITRPRLISQINTTKQQYHSPLNGKRKQ
ncbi:spore germination protein [Pseudalkalibacillus sp. Hm43]|uniref:spore germination protein n=1 Tax=Pseudalkalibacillus sp. Hm43 TaxID=3450742 RepID=UPI003F444F15